MDNHKISLTDMDHDAFHPGTIPFALYVHLPWCESKCPYCDFNSHPLKTTLHEKEYIDALLHDLDLDLKDYAASIGTRNLDSIFIGGGTPSLFSSDAIAHLLASIKQRVPCSDNIEVSLEANPGSGDVEKFQGYRSAGVNRLSLGVQSFNDRQLQALGRVHTSTQALTAVEAVICAGFDNFNIDLMFGLPQQNVPDALTDLTRAIECQPAHLSCYQLTIEPNTWFHRYPPTLPADDLLWDMQEGITDTLVNAGYRQYEVSAFARNELICQHNKNYWHFGDYLGIGAGAHGKITGTDGVVRMWKIKHPRQYLHSSSTQQRNGGKKRIRTQDLVLEFMLNALRLRERISVSLFSSRTGLAPSYIETELAAAEKAGLLDWSEDGFLASERGYRHLNTLLEYFVLSGDMETRALSV